MLYHFRACKFTFLESNKVTETLQQRVHATLFLEALFNTKSSLNYEFNGTSFHLKILQSFCQSNIGQLVCRKNADFL